MKVTNSGHYLLKLINKEFREFIERRKLMVFPIENEVLRRMNLEVVLLMSSDYLANFALIYRDLRPPPPHDRSYILFLVSWAAEIRQQFFSATAHTDKEVIEILSRFFNLD